MNSEQIYGSYQSYCESIGVTPAPFAVYFHEVNSAEGSTTTNNRDGRICSVVHAGRTLKRAFVLQIGFALGIDDEAGMLKSLGLLDADGNITPKGRKISRVRTINGAEYVLWNLSKIGRMLGKLEPEPNKSEPETEPAPEPEILELLTTNHEIDTTFSAPEPDSLEEVAA